MEPRQLMVTGTSFLYISMLNFIIETVEFTKLVKELKAKVVDMKNQLKPLKEK
jgi:hypothetical protein